MKTLAEDFIGISTRLKILTLSLMLPMSILLISTKAHGQKPAIDELNKPEAIVATRRVFVRSKSLLVRGAVVEDKLLKRPEFKQLGFSITRDESDADIILELRHDLLTKYVFTVIEVKTQTVLAGGKLSSLGGTVAGKVARRFVKEMVRTRTS
jgi:hypothetical protein